MVFVLMILCVEVGRVLGVTQETAGRRMDLDRLLSLPSIKDELVAGLVEELKKARTELARKSARLEELEEQQLLPSTKMRKLSDSVCYQSTSRESRQLSRGALVSLVARELNGHSLPLLYSTVCATRRPYKNFPDWNDYFWSLGVAEMSQLLRVPAPQPMLNNQVDEDYDHQHIVLSHAEVGCVLSLFQILF
jgi:hypothetical protein